MFNPSAMMGGGSGSGTSGGSSSGGMNVFDPNAMMGGENGKSWVNPCPGEPGYILFRKHCRSRSVGSL